MLIILWICIHTIHSNTKEFSPSVSSVAQSCPTLCDPMNRSTPGLPVHHQLPEFTQTHVHRVSEAIQPSHPLSSPSAPALNPSQHQSLFSESTLHMRWPKYWSFSFSIIPSKEIPELISFRMDWLDLLAVQGTLKDYKYVRFWNALLCSADLCDNLSWEITHLNGPPVLDRCSLCFKEKPSEGKEGGIIHEGPQVQGCSHPASDRLPGLSNSPKEPVFYF